MSPATTRGVRTSSFKLTPELCGEVYVWRATPHFQREWSKLKDVWLSRLKEAQPELRLPHRSLGAALTVLTGDFVHVEPHLAGEGDPIVFASRALMSRQHVELALMAWEMGVLGTDHNIAGFAGELVPTRVPLWEVWEGRRSSRALPQWWFAAARWQIAHRLLERPLEVDGACVPWRADSEVSLLSWDTPIYGTGEAPRYLALHRLLLHPIWIPGHTEPFISIVPRVSCLTETLQFHVKNVWIPTRAGLPIIRAGLVRCKTDGAWGVDWSRDAAALLEDAAQLRLPPLNDESLRAGLIRAVPKHRDFKCTIGRGPGQRMYDAVAHWARSCLHEAAPYELWPAGRKVPKPSRRSFGPEQRREMFGQLGGRLQVHCVYRSEFVRQQMAAGLALLLERPLPARQRLARALLEVASGTPLPHPTSGVEVTFHPVSESIPLDHFVTRGVFREVVTPLLDSIGAPSSSCFLVETLPGDQLRRQKAAAARQARSAGAGREPLEDPKHLMRQALAERGCPCQFITPPWVPQGQEWPCVETVVEAGNSLLPGVPADETGAGGRGLPRRLAFQALNSALDLARGRGLSPWAMAGEELGFPTGTWLVGITGVRRQRSGRSQTDPSRAWSLAITATRVGRRGAEVFVPGGGWVPFWEGNTWFHRDLNLLSEEEALEASLKALEALLERPGDEQIITFVDGRAIRQLWPWLKESRQGVPLPPQLQDERISIVRCRLGRDELPSVAGRGPWGSLADGKVYNNADSLFTEGASAAAGAFIYVKASHIQSSQGTGPARGLHRERTRFTLTDPSDQRVEWHALGSREILVVQSRRSDALTLAALTVLLHRTAPSWDKGTLARPAPLHLSYQMLGDHPQQPLEEPPDPDDLGDTDEA